MRPPFHDSDAPRPRLGEVLFDFDALSGPGEVDYGNELAEWAGRGVDPVVVVVNLRESEWDAMR